MPTSPCSSYGVNSPFAAKLTCLQLARSSKNLLSMGSASINWELRREEIGTSGMGGFYHMIQRT